MLKPRCQVSVLVWLLKNRFQFCLRTASVSELQFRFHSRKLFYCEYDLFKFSTCWRFCFITVISSSSDSQVRRVIASEVVDLSMIPSPMKPKTQKLVFTASPFDAPRKRNCAGVRKLREAKYAKNHFQQNRHSVFESHVMRKETISTNILRSHGNSEVV